MASIDATSATSNIADYVTQLINLERSTGPEQYYQTQKDAYTQENATLTDLKTDLTALNTQAQALGQPGTLSPLAAKTVSFATTGIATAAATSGAVNDTHTLSVTQLAKQSTVFSNQLASADTSLAATVGAGLQTFQVSVGGVATSVSVTIGATDSNQTVLNTMAAAINASGATVTASVIQDTNATSRLVLTAKQVGSASALTMQDTSGTLLAASGTTADVLSSGTNGGALYAASALDANFTLDGLAITRSSNTITDVLPGVTLTLTASQAPNGAPVSFTVSPDQSGVQAKVQAFLDAYNTALKFLTDRTGITVTPNTDSSSTDSSTSADSQMTVTRGTLADDFTYLGLRMNLRSDVGGQITTPGASGPSMLAEVGITAAADGTLSISDTSKFNAALTSNPDGVVALFNSADGIASRVTNRLTSFLTTGGVVDSSQQAMTADITAMNSAIDEQENLLKIRQEQLTQQYTALAEVMAQLQMQQGVVTDYLNSLNSSSSTTSTG